MNLLQTNSRIINHCKLTSFISCSAQSRNLFSLFSTLMQSYVPTFLSKPNTYIALQSNSSLYFWSRQNISIDLPYQFAQVKKTPYIGRFPLNNIYLTVRFLYKGIIIKHNKTEPTYTKTSLFLCEKRRFFMARTEKGVVTTI